MADEPRQFRSNDDYFAPAAKVLPVAGRMWSFPATINSQIALALMKMQHYAQGSKATAEGGLEILQHTLGEDAGQMVTDAVLGEGAEEKLLGAGVTAEHATHIQQTLIVWHLRGRDAALTAWESTPGEAVPPNRKGRRAAAKGAPARSARQVSTAGSTTRTRAAAAARSPGRRSSTALT